MNYIEIISIKTATWLSDFVLNTILLLNVALLRFLHRLTKNKIAVSDEICFKTVSKFIDFFMS